MMKVQTILIDSLILISATFLSGPWTEPFGQSDQKKSEQRSGLLDGEKNSISYY